MISPLQVNDVTLEDDGKMYVLTLQFENTDAKHKKAKSSSSVKIADNQGAQKKPSTVKSKVSLVHKTACI